MWGMLIVLFIACWLLQILLSVLQMKHYQKTVARLSNRPSGYLGVGVEKKRLGIGTVMVIVTDTDGTIVDCEVMSGVTVFSRFRKCKRFIGADLFQLTLTSEEQKYLPSFAGARANIERQMNVATQ
ncbi:transcriptional regulator GutM [Brevibacillus fulvus]|uniref:Glucitol operon activator protein n=1 Tax=Brevibacillus fulvus TaxID=1125967 RepID=A0A938Y1Z2_9BACL|nr:transcriptional regulator GutM [Brevibacillus fulvus]MBM7591688.1 glucitol operon activator protein [Brevibacillus fulvus]